MLGAVIGGISMFVLRELLVPLALYDMLAYGVILCVFLLFMPGGIRGVISSLEDWLERGRRDERSFA